MKKHILLVAALLVLAAAPAFSGEWIRTNQLGYLPESVKVAVYMSNDPVEISSFRVIDLFSGEVVYTSRPEDIRSTGALGQMASTYRLDFSRLETVGSYRLEAGGAVSGNIPINGTVYNGTADFLLNYMRQQRCGWNPFLRDSCHVHDAYIRYHPEKEGQHLDVTGGWHDATDCLQYTTTSANAIYQMAFAYLQNPSSFGDAYLADGTPGVNGIPDIIDEIYWGLTWLNKMNPAPGEYYNQIADDRDHMGMRRPHDDKADYGRGPGQERPVYFITGKPQQRKDKLNVTTGAASTVGKFASSFALGSKVLEPFYPEFASSLAAKASDAYDFAAASPGNCQTASVTAPYIYEEDNWTDDMELGAMEMYHLTSDRSYIEQAVEYGRREPVTPWMGADSARHYQWYPFVNLGHYWLAKDAGGRTGEEFVRNLRSGIQRTWEKADGTPFCYGIPSIWCSNNLTAAMITQCILYRQLTGDRRYEEMEAALRDWLLGCNPWGVSMIVELPYGGVYPTQPHSFLTSLGLGNTTGGLVDGPVYAGIFGSLLDVNMEGGINYLEFQPDLMVYHDSVNDYSSNEPTMDGTASLSFAFSTYEAEGRSQTMASEDRNVYDEGGIVRTDPARKRISLVFTAADKADGADKIISTLDAAGIKGGFFFTGEFFEKFPDVVRRLVEGGHYVGSHSYGHLLYASWDDRDSLYVTREEFEADMLKSFSVMEPFGITRETSPYFIPPYEYYNRETASWADAMGLQMVNFTAGTGTNGDYTTPDMENYMSSKYIWDRVMRYEKENGLNGNIMLIHFGTEDSRKDKFYDRLPALIRTLRKKGYEFVSIPEAVGLQMSR